MAGFSRTSLVPLVIIAAGAFGIVTSPGIEAAEEIQNANTTQTSPVPSALRPVSQQQLDGAAGDSSLMAALERLVCRNALCARDADQHVERGEAETSVHLDAATGRKLWEFQCGAGVNAPAVSYMVNGKQYIAVAAGGNTQLDFKRGNTVLVFALP